jgi:hypothetical protein
VGHCWRSISQTQLQFQLKGGRLNERPGNDCSLAFKCTKELHDCTGIGQNFIDNGGDGRFFEGIHDLSFLVVIIDETFRECHGVHKDCWIKTDHGRVEIIGIPSSERIGLICEPNCWERVMVSGRIVLGIGKQYVLYIIEIYRWLMVKGE